MGVFYFPSDFVYWEKIKEHEKFKKQITTLISKNKEYISEHKLVVNGKSTHTTDNNYYKNQLNKLILQNNQMIKSIVWETLDNAINELNSRKGFQELRYKESSILNFWCSLYDKNSTVKCHNHSNNQEYIIKNEVFKPTFSLIYIVKDDNEENQTEFIQPSMCGISTSRNAQTNFNTKYIKDIGEGTVMIFPSTLYHFVNNIEKPGRIIFSFNIISSFLN